MEENALKKAGEITVSNDTGTRIIDGRKEKPPA
jgi:hypothetical protein